VTADGSIINVDAKEDAELAVALRGSGSQFGEQWICLENVQSEV
jgi:hypothetical protein